MLWTTSQELLDAGVTVQTIADWTSKDASEVADLRFPSFTITDLLDHTFEARGNKS